MRTDLLLLALVFSLLLARNTHAQFTENFNDGDFTSGNVWGGDAALWLVEDTILASNSQIVNDTFYLSTPITTLPGLEWRLFLELKFQTSSNNYVDVYLLSDQANLNDSGVNGYFVRIGNTQDEISLYRRNGNVVTKIIDGVDGRSQPGSTVKIDLKITWSDAGVFELFDDNTGSGFNYFSEGTVTDNTISSGEFFGFSVKQSTSSFFNKHFFDNIYIGPIQIDTAPPDLLSATPFSNKILDVYFSEPLKQSVAEDINNYVINNGIGAADSARLNTLNPSIVRLFVTNQFLNNNSYTLTVAGIEDIAGNALTFATTTFSYYTPQPGDIVINEIFPDPEPQVSLPNAEFIELYNSSSSAINLGGWIFSDLTSSVTLPPFNLLPDSFVILCSGSNAGLFGSYGSVIAVSSFPSLNNSGDLITLKSPDQTVISEVNYTDAWYQNSAKKEGGWTIELIDPFSPCIGAANWIASMDSSGGTPGKINSVYLSQIDTLAPIVTSSSINPFDTIIINFNETIDSIQASQISNYSIDNNIGQPQSVIINSPVFNQIKLITSGPLEVNRLYTVQINQLKDCRGNSATNPIKIVVAIPDNIAPQDIVINEILFNPTSNGFDYVELYNRSDKILDVNDLVLASISSTGTVTEKSIVVETRLMKPNEFIVVCQDTAWLRLNYITSDPSAFIDMSSLPSYNDDAGTAIIKNANNKTIDSLTYSGDWNFPLIEDNDGVSLERVSYGADTNNPDNWQSAAASVGFGTPGLKNSMAYSDQVITDEITLDTKVFSPDQDGYQDLLRINYQFDKPGYVCTIRIFDERGTLIQNLANNLTLTQTGFVVWDGIDLNSERAPVGPYVLLIELFDTSGTVKQYKKTCVLAGRIRD